MKEQRTLDFLNLLYEEKLRHKEHRHEFVKQKMIFTITLFGLGSVNISQISNIGMLLYLVPFVALAFDIYILSEDFKVKRVGLFIRKHKELEVNACEDELKWEKWVSDNREPLAALASLVLSVIAFVASAFILWCREREDKSLVVFFTLWLGLSFLCLCLVYFYYKDLRKRLRQELKRGSKKNKEQ